MQIFNFSYFIFYPDLLISIFDGSFEILFLN